MLNDENKENKELSYLEQEPSPLMLLIENLWRSIQKDDPKAAKRSYWVLQGVSLALTGEAYEEADMLTGIAWGYVRDSFN